MIKIFALILTVGGAIALVMGILGIFGSLALALSRHYPAKCVKLK